MTREGKLGRASNPSYLSRMTGTLCISVSPDPRLLVKPNHVREHACETAGHVCPNGETRRNFLVSALALSRAGQTSTRSSDSCSLGG